MNKKVMAFAMAAVMLMVALTVGVSVQSDAEEGTGGATTSAGAVGTEGNPRYIVGTSDKGMEMLIGNVDEKKKTVDAYIDFNKAAFTSSATVVFQYKEGSSNYEELLSSTSTGPVTSTNFKITLSPVDDYGKYKATFELTGTTAVDSTVYIKLTVEDGKETDQKVTQSYFYAAHFNVVSKNKVIFEDSDSEVIASSYAFTYQDSHEITVKVVSGEGSTNAIDGYNFYATGLPKGVWMRVDGTIGGKVDQNETPTGAGKAVVYAVNVSGNVIKGELNWTLSQKETAGKFTVTIADGDDNTSTTSDGKDYVTLKRSDDKATITIEGINEGSAESTVSVAANITNITGQGVSSTDDGWTLDISGTGSLKITITADVTKNGTTYSVVKTVTVYVVGEIVDADLDPSVTSR